MGELADRIRRQSDKSAGGSLAERIRAGSQQQESSLVSDVAGSLGGGFTRGVGQMLDLPQAAGEWFANVTGLSDLEQRAFGALGAQPPSIPRAGTALESGLAQAGMATPPGQEHAIPFLGQVGEVVGESAVPFGVMGTAARTGAQGGMITGPMLNAFRQSPRLNALAEGSGALGAGLGGAAAQQVFPDSPLAEQAGSVLGGVMLPTAAVSRAAVSGRAPVAGRIRRHLDPVLPGGARRSAARQLQRTMRSDPSSADPQMLAKRLRGRPDQVPGAALTPAEETGDTTLLNVQRTLEAVDPKTAEALASRRATSNRAIREAGEDMQQGNIARTREFVQGRVDDAVQRMEARRAQAIQKANERISAVQPKNRNRSELNRIAREEMNDAYSYAKGIEAEKWGKVPESLTAPTETVRQRYSSVLDGLSKSERAKVDEVLPGYVRKVLAGKGKGAFGTKESIKELQSFRSDLLEDARNAMAGDTPNRVRARVLNELADAALEDMNSVPAASDALTDARNYTRELHDRFSRGPVGRVLGLQRTGGQRTDPSVTLERLLTPTGPQGEVNIQAVRKAVAESPEVARQAEDTLSDFIRTRFVKETTDAQSNVVSGSAQTFMRNNKELLDQVPGLRDELAGATTAQEVVERVGQQMAARQAGLQNKRISRAALFLDAPVDREIQAVLNSKNPASNMRELVRQASKDRTGDALEGLRAQFIRDWLKSGRSQIMDAEGVRMVRGNNLDDWFARNRDVITDSGLFTKEHRKRMRKIIETAQKIERAQARGQNVSEIIEESPDAAIDLVSRIVGANVGAAGAAGTTGAPIVAAGAGSRFTRQITNKIPMERTHEVLAQAVLDRKIMADLLTRMDGPQKAEGLQRSMNSWLYSLFPEAQQLQQEQQQEQP